MTNEQQKPVTPASNPSQAPQQNPQQDQSGNKPNTDKPAVQPQQT
jgi:hypothetical protein